MYTNAMNSLTSSAETGSSVYWRAMSMASLEGLHFDLWGMALMGLLPNPATDFNDSAFNEVGIEEGQASTSPKGDLHIDLVGLPLPGSMAVLNCF